VRGGRAPRVGVVARPSETVHYAEARVTCLKAI